MREQKRDAMTPRPLRCRLGWHAWYSDIAFLFSADRCDRCGKYRDPYSADLMIREREAWAEVDDTLPRDVQVGRVAQRVMTGKADV